MVDIAIDASIIRTKRTLERNKKLKIFGESFFNTILRILETEYGEENCRSGEIYVIAGFNKIHLKSHCVIGSILNGVRKLRFLNFSLDKPMG